MALIDANYLTDASLIEKYMGSESLRSASEESPLNKVAGVTEVFQSVASGLYAEAAKMWDPENPIKSIINFTATGLITIFTPWWLGLIYFVASEFFEFSFGDVFEKIKSYIVQTLQTKKTVSGKRTISGDDVDKGVDSILWGGAKASDHVTAEQTERLLKKMSTLQEMFRDQMIIQSSINKTSGAINLLLKPLKLLISPSVAKTFLGKVLKFIFKTFLIGVAKAKAGALGRGVVGGTGPHGETSPGLFGGPSAPKSSKITHNLKPNGAFGTEQENGNWEEGFAVSDTANQIANWAVSRYSQLATKKNDMMQTQSFKNVVKAITDNNSRNHYPSTTYIPHKIMGDTVNSKAELVDLFVGEIAQKLEKPGP